MGTSDLLEELFLELILFSAIISLFYFLYTVVSQISLKELGIFLLKPIAVGVFLYFLVLQFFNFFNHTTESLNEFNYLTITAMVQLLFPEVVLLGSIIISFFYYLYTSSSKIVGMINYVQCLLCIFILYFLFAGLELGLIKIVVMNGIFLVDSNIYLVKIFISFLIILFFSIFYLQLRYIQYFILELPLLISCLFWIFLIGFLSFNFFLLFLIIEIITILLVIIISLYSILLGPQIIRFIIQFFILNVVISLFYLFGLALLLYISGYNQQYSFAYSLFIDVYIQLIFYGVHINIIVVCLKCLISLLFLPFIFKLTFAPFSIWVVNIYSKMSYLLLIILIVFYKVSYSVYFLLILNWLLISIPVFSTFIIYYSYLFILPSLFIGCLAFYEQNLKKILAYTTVSQFAYIFSGLVLDNPQILKYSLLYLLCYSLQLLSILLIFLLLQGYNISVTYLNQLFIVKYYNKFYYYSLVILFFSIAGIPPLQGFLIKYFLFLELINNGYVIAAILGLLANFIIAIIYFNVLIQILLQKPTHYHIFSNIQFKKIFNVLSVSYKHRYDVILIAVNLFVYAIVAFNIVFIFLVPYIDYYLIEFIYSFKYSFYTINVAAENIFDISQSGDLDSVKDIEAKSLKEFNVVNSHQSEIIFKNLEAEKKVFEIMQQYFSSNRKYGQ